jgi:hypothetical protein
MVAQGRPIHRPDLAGLGGIWGLRGRFLPIGSGNRKHGQMATFQDSFDILMLASGHLGKKPAAILLVEAQPAKPFASVLSYRGAGRKGLRQCAESYFGVNAVCCVVHVVFSWVVVVAGAMRITAPAGQIGPRHIPHLFFGDPRRKWVPTEEIWPNGHPSGGRQG